MRTILVTGGAGFIGSAVVREIIQHTADRVVVVDKLTYAGNLMSLAPVAQDARFTFEQVDICDRGELDRIFRQHQPDTVMHLAAESHVDRSIDGPAAFIETNILGTYTLLEAARSWWNTPGHGEKIGVPFSPYLDRRSVWRSARQRGFLYRDHALCAKQPLFGLESQQRPPGARLAADLWPADAYHQLLQ